MNMKLSKEINSTHGKYLCQKLDTKLPGNTMVLAVMVAQIHHLEVCQLMNGDRHHIHWVQEFEGLDKNQPLSSILYNQRCGCFSPRTLQWLSQCSVWAAVSSPEPLPSQFPWTLWPDRDTWLVHILSCGLQPMLAIAATCLIILHQNPGLTDIGPEVPGEVLDGKMAIRGGHVEELKLEKQLLLCQQESGMKLRQDIVDIVSWISCWLV